jgi:uncharacterized membrane protein required for colicin V production
MALSASSLAPKIRAVSTCAEKTVSTANLTFANTASNSVKSTLNNWFNDDVTSEQKQQQFNAIVDISSSEFKQALEQESGQTLEKIKQKTDFNANKNIPKTPDWVDDALAEINQNPLNKFQDQLDATANNPELN